MTPLHPAPVDIEDPLEGSGWRVSRPDDEGALHTEVLRELCDTGGVLQVGGTGERGVPAVLRLVDVVLQQLVLVSHADGIDIARALLARPVWAAARLHNLRVQFALMAPSVTRERLALAGGETFLIAAHWPRDIHRASRRAVPRVGPLARVAHAARVAHVAHAAHAQHCAPVARFHHSNQLVSTRDFTLLDISEQGAAVLLPARVAPPAAGSCIRRIELELDDEHLLFTDAHVEYVNATRHGTHRIGCRWAGMPAAGQRTLRRWLAAAAGGDPRAAPGAPASGGSRPLPATLQAG